MNFPALVIAICCSAASATAQDFSFTVDAANSNYNWSGTTSLGPLEGNPSTSFQLSGSIELDLSTGGSPVSMGQWVSSDLLVSPDLAGKVPNPVSFLPPLALIDVAGMRFSISSDPFSVDAAGNFSTTTNLVITTGTLTVTPLVGTPTVTDLAGTQGPPTATTGTINMTTGVMSFVSPMMTGFMFTDPTSGVSANLNLNGTITADYTCPAPTNYCAVSPNSVGAGSQMGWTGSTSMSAGTFDMTASGCPANKPGLFFMGMNQVSIPLGNGMLCASGQIKRFPVVISSAAGVFSQPVNFNVLPGGLVLTAGDNTNFQCWYRDVAAGGAGFNLSDGLGVLLCP